MRHRPPVPRVSLIVPTLEDRRRVFAWMTTPGIVEHMMGAPLFPDTPPPDYEEFEEDWAPHYWTHSAPEKGRLFLIQHEGEAVGMVAHNDVVTTSAGERASELDIWLRRPGDVGRGIGSAAVSAALDLLKRDLGVELAFLQPSGRNPRAIRAYEKAGFVRVPMGPDEAAEHFCTEADYEDAVFLSCALTGR